MQRLNFLKPNQEEIGGLKKAISKNIQKYPTLKKNRIKKSELSFESLSIEKPKF